MSSDEHSSIERRAGMEETNRRLTVIETVVENELGKDGRLHRDLGEVKDLVTSIDDTLRGSNGVGIGERIRKLERNQGLIITGLGMALAGAARVGWEWARVKLGGGGP